MSGSGQRVAIVGPSPLGAALAGAFVRAGDRVVAVAGGTPEARAEFTARTAGVRDFDRPEEATADAGLIVLTLPAAELEGAVTALVRADALRPQHRVVHTAGPVGSSCLERAALAGAGTAACHPVVSSEPGVEDLVGAAWLVTASAPDRAWALDLVERLAGDAHVVAEDARGRVDAGLELARAGVGAVVSAARRLLVSAGVDGSGALVAALAGGAVQRVAATGAVGIDGAVPAGDLDTVRRHLAALDLDVPELLATYRDLVAATVGQVSPALAPEVVAELATALGRELPVPPRT